MRLSTATVAQLAFNGDNEARYCLHKAASALLDVAPRPCECRFWWQPVYGLRLQLVSVDPSPGVYSGE